MSTTVVASRHGSSLFLLPATSPPLDTDALRRVLERHGLDLVDGSDLLQASEFIAAEGLDPASASALAEDLRGIGLHARVVNRTALTTSRRTSNALGAQSMVGMVGFMVLMSANIPVLQALKHGADLPMLTLIPTTIGLLLLLLAVVNAVVLSRQGGVGLRVAGVAHGPIPSSRQLSQRLAELEEHLPAHLAAPLLERARQLEAHALREPDGQAARELEALMLDLRGQADAQATKEARELRRDVARARKAMKETGGR